jgi:hypothetical protein
MNLEALFRKIGGRKFLLVIIVSIVTYLFVYQGLVTKEDFVALVKMLLVAYPASAVGQTLLTKDTPEDVAEESVKADYRKFFFTILVFALVCDLLFRKRIDSSQYMDLNQWLVGLYLSGNVMAKFAEQLPNVAAAIGKKS